MNRIILKASNGEEIDVYPGSAGLDTGWGRVVNGYLEGLEGWRFKDGDTVVSAQPDEEGALPVADAYQKLRQIFDEETLCLAQYEWDEIQAGKAPEIWGTEEEWKTRYPSRIVERVNKASASLGS